VKPNRIIRIIMVIFLIVGIAMAISYRKNFNITILENWLATAGGMAPLIFVGIYVISTVLFLPGSVLTLAGGIFFGPIWGTFYNLTGATIGATIAFLIARYLASDWVSRKASGWLKQLIEGVETEGWRFVAFVRLVPIFPFNILNYALGLTRIRLFHYVITSYICMLPGAIAYTYIGYAGRNAAVGGEGLIRKILLAMGLFVMVAFLPRFIRRLRQKPIRMLSSIELKQRFDQKDGTLVLDVRGVDEYGGDLGHIAGSINIPIEDLSRRLNELGTYKQRFVVIVCHTDHRSLKAAQLLIKTGFADIAVLQGGIEQWNRNGLPVE